jgi:hypothetical protein
MAQEGEAALPGELAALGAVLAPSCDGRYDNWDQHVRAANARCWGGGPCVLDATPNHMLNYSQGSYSLVQRELRAVLPPAAADAVDRLCAESGVADAFAARRELVNFKKICLNTYQLAKAYEKDLRQLTTFFFCDMVQTDHRDPAHRRYVELCRIMFEAKGALEAVHDARDITKAIASLPRHPDTSWPARLCGLPATSMVWRRAIQAVKATTPISVEPQPEVEPQGVDAPRGGDTEVGAAPSGECTPVDDESGVDLELLFRRFATARLPVVAAAGLDGSWAAVGGVLDAVEAELVGWDWPPPVCAFVQAALVGRGATKALAVRAAAVQYHSLAEALPEQLADALARLRPALATIEANLGGDSRVDLTALMRLRKSSSLATGALAVATELAPWLGAVASARASDARLFVAGDSVLKSGGAPSRLQSV